jgi:mannosyltransferase OCH1-like enzyme
MYNQTNPSLHALRADLWRYCGLYTDGGVYMDADVGVNRQIALSRWIGGNVVLSQGGNHWDVMVADCTRIWKTINLPFPRNIMTNHSLAQWAMIFPRPKHPILRETINLATELIDKWVDNNKTGFPMKLRVVCLSGPAILAVSADRVYRANNNTWDGLGITMESGTDYGGKLQYKNYAYMKLLFDENDESANKRYDRMEPHVPLKVAA